MYNLNKTYHKGKYRGGEWGKHIRPYLKRLGNKRFRKISDTLEATEQDRQHLYKKKTGKRHIKAKITLSSNGDRISSYYRTYRSMKDLQNAVNRAYVIRYVIIDKIK